MAIVSDSVIPKSLAVGEVEQRLQHRNIGELQYYNSEVHGALFALPNYYRKLLPEMAEIG